MLGSGLLGVAIERFAYRPLRNAPRIAPLISALGVSFFLQNAALLLFGADFRSYDTYDLHRPRRPGIHWGPLNISLVRLIVIADRGRADARADAARRAHAARQGDARDRRSTARRPR